MLSKICYNTTDTRVSLGLLGVRVLFGSAMMMHGMMKIQSPMSWMGPEAPVPGFLQALAAIAEFGGGIAWIVGGLTPLFSFLIFCTMTVAALFHISKGDPFVGQGGSWELASLYWMTAVLLFLSGPGKYSLDHKICKKK